MRKSAIEKLLEKHPQLIHSEAVKVASHVQREEDEWWVNTIMVEGIEVPFKYKRKKRYQSLRGALVNITYYPSSEDIADIPFEYMKIVRLKRS